MSNADVVHTLLQLSGCIARLGRFDEAEALIDEYEAIARRDGLTSYVIRAQGHRGVYALWRGDAERAVALVEKALAGFWESKNHSGVSVALDDLTFGLAAMGRHAEAIRLAGTAEALREAMGTAISPQAALDLERYLGPSRRMLGEEAASALFAEGRATPVDDAVSAHLRRRREPRP
jgi:tetratricopeptide (TPR) repeat protein